MIMISISFWRNGPNQLFRDQDKRGGPPPNDNSAHALLRGLSDPALSVSGIGGSFGSEGEKYLMITET